MDHKEFFEKFGNESFNNLPGLTPNIFCNYVKQRLIEQIGVYSDNSISRQSMGRYSGRLIDREDD